MSVISGSLLDQKYTSSKSIDDSIHRSYRDHEFHENDDDDDAKNRHGSGDVIKKDGDGGNGTGGVSTKRNDEDNDDDDGNNNDDSEYGTPGDYFYLEKLQEARSNVTNKTFAKGRRSASVPSSSNNNNNPSNSRKNSSNDTRPSISLTITNPASSSADKRMVYITPITPTTTTTPTTPTAATTTTNNTNPQRNAATAERSISLNSANCFNNVFCGPSNVKNTNVTLRNNKIKPNNNNNNNNNNNSKQINLVSKDRNCLNKKTKPQKYGFHKSSFAKEMEEQFEASRNCYSTRPKMRFDGARKLQVNRRLYNVCSFVTLINIVVGTAVLLMTVYTCFRVTKERERMERDLRKVGVRMRMGRSINKSQAIDEYENITAWEELPTDNESIESIESKNESNFVNAVEFEAKSGKFVARVDGFYQIFCRLHVGPGDSLAIAVLIVDGDTFAARLSGQACPNASVCQSITLSRIVHMKAGQYAMVEKKCRIVEHVDSYFFMHLV